MTADVARSTRTRLVGSWTQSDVSSAANQRGAAWIADLDPAEWLYLVVQVRSRRSQAARGEVCRRHEEGRGDPEQQEAAWP